MSDVVLYVTEDEAHHAAHLLVHSGYDIDLQPKAAPGRARAARLVVHGALDAQAVTDVLPGVDYEVAGA